MRAQALSEDWSVHLQTISHPSWVNVIAVSPNGQLIVSSPNDKTGRVWDAAIGAKRHVLQGHSDGIYAIAFSPDGQPIVPGSCDNTVRVWDAATGAERHLLPIDTTLRFLSCSSRGKHLVTDRGTFRLPDSDC